MWLKMANYITAEPTFKLIYKWYKIGLLNIEIVNVRFGTAQIFCPPDPSPPQAGEDRIPFELFLIYTAKKIPK